jgi:plastocyanin
MLSSSSNMFPHTIASRARVTVWASLGILACLLLLAACGESSSTAGNNPTATTAPTSTTAPTATAAATTPAASGAATITMGVVSFADPTSVTIKAGQSVTFTSNGTHNLVIGKHGQFSAENGAPSELNTSGGDTFTPGDSQTIVFPSAGTFDITCTIHASMQATVTVTH